MQPLANGKVVALLEGGYNLTSLAESAALTVKGTLIYDVRTPKAEEITEKLLECDSGKR